MARAGLGAAMEAPVVWRPSDDQVRTASITRYAEWLRHRLGRGFDSYDELWRWSVSDLEAFWGSIWDYFDVGPPCPPALTSPDMPGARWFPRARLNYAAHVFRGKDDSAIALHHASELDDEVGLLTWAELRALTSRIAAGLRAQGVRRGDRVVGYVPNVPEAVAAMLACASLGAVWSSCSPDFGAQAIVDRFAQIDPVVLIAVDGYRYGGRDFDRREVVAGLIPQLPYLKAAVLIGYLDHDATLDGAIGWEEFLGPAEAVLEFDDVPFDSPLWVLYSSGTTGPPKAIVHGHGGILLEQLKHHHLHLDLRRGDRIMWFTTTGWMMWNFLVGCLLTDASIVLFDGNPGHPSSERLWDLAADCGVTCFGTSPAFLAGCMTTGVVPTVGRDLSRLRTIGATGAPLPPEAFTWVYEQFPPHTWLFSTSGGTDVCAPFVGGVPTVPVRTGEIQVRLLGASVEAFDEQGSSVIDEVGELVLTRPLPSMPLGLWGDPDGHRLHETYFDVYPGVWRHGDWAKITDQGGVVVYGRSDSTINRGGVRMGTSEIYRAVLSLDEIADALVVDVDGWMPLFVVLSPGVRLDGDLTRAIAHRVRTRCSPRHTPDEVYAVAEVPRTRSGKILEVPVKRILQGMPADRAASRDSLAIPGALDWFVELAARRRQLPRRHDAAAGPGSRHGSRASDHTTRK